MTKGIRRPFLSSLCMHLKDYYGILELPPSATQQEIKKAYRKLAQQHHPDKNDNDPYSGNKFAEIKEAYEVLTNPSTKEYYLQQRWYDQSMGKKRSAQVMTPDSILKQALELERYVAKLDAFRMDKQGLHDHIMAIVDNPTVQKLNNFNERDINNEIVSALVKSLKPLPLFYINSLQQQLNKIHKDDRTQEILEQLVRSKQKAHEQDKYRIWVILLTVLVLCMIIFFAGK
ncbi:MAG TPA: DnaJ domain-containing protein [Chitinophagaceae bacterium]|nr:DnaJ domain-containing protein [Chitinophagaceae bacterium]